MVLRRLEPNVHVLLSSFAVRSRCVIRIVGKMPSKGTRQKVIERKLLLVLALEDGYHLGFCNAHLEYQEKRIESRMVLDFIWNYRAGERIYNTDHADKINALLEPELRLTAQLLNIALYIEGGPAPIIRTIVKNRASDQDLEYSGFETPIQLFSNPAQFPVDLHFEFTATHTMLIPNNGFFEFRTEGGARCVQLVDICLDHHTTHGHDLFLHRVRDDNSPMEILPDQIEHCITSNTCFPEYSHAIARRMLQIDPMESHLWEYPAPFGHHVVTETELNSLVPPFYKLMGVAEREHGFLVKKPPFGARYLIDVLEERPATHFRDKFRTVIGAHHLRVAERLFLREGGRIFGPSSEAPKEHPDIWDIFFNFDTYLWTNPTEDQMAVITHVLRDREILHWCLHHMKPRMLLAMFLSLKEEDVMPMMNEEVWFILLKRVPKIVEKFLPSWPVASILHLAQSQNRQQEYFLQLCFQNPEVLDILLNIDGITPVIASQLKTAADIRDFFQAINPKRALNLFPSLSVLIMQQIHSRVTLVMVLQHLPAESRKDLCHNLAEKWSSLILSVADLIAIFPLFNHEEKLFVCNLLNEQHLLGEMANSIFALYKMIQHIPEAYHAHLLDAITRSNGWRRLIQPQQPFTSLLSALPKKLHHHPAIEKLKEKEKPRFKTFFSESEVRAESPVKAVRDGPTPS